VNKLKKSYLYYIFLHYSLFFSIFQCRDTKNESIEDLKAKIKNHEIFHLFMNKTGRGLEQELNILYNSVMGHIILLKLLSEHEKKNLNFKQHMIDPVLSFQELVNKLPLRERHAIHEIIFLVNQKRIEKINKNKKLFNNENKKNIEACSCYQLRIANILRNEKIKKQYDIINEIWWKKCLSQENFIPFNHNVAK
jgi:hypothetical protein